LHCRPVGTAVYLQSEILHADPWSTFITASVLPDSLPLSQVDLVGLSATRDICRRIANWHARIPCIIDKCSKGGVGSPYPVVLHAVAPPSFWSFQLWLAFTCWMAFSQSMDSHMGTSHASRPPTHPPPSTRSATNQRLPVEHLIHLHCISNPLERLVMVFGQQYSSAMVKPRELLALVMANAMTNFPTSRRLRN